MIQVLKPERVKKIVCVSCGELMVKFYPWSTIDFQGAIPPCKKCVNKQYKQSILPNKILYERQKNQTTP